MNGDPAAGLSDASRRWVREQLQPNERIGDVVSLHGGWTSEVRRIEVSGPGGERWLVLRSFVRPELTDAAEELLTREAEVLRFLEATEVPTARLVAVDARAERCTYPSLLMTCLPGAVTLGQDGAEARADLLAAELVRIHGVAVDSWTRPRTYQAWTAPERVTIPAATARPQVWREAVEIIRREPPAHSPCFLHRDYHPGNVLFDDRGGALRITGVVDWVETSWGPADLDVAHCSTNLALLHGVPAGMAFRDRYLHEGGSLAEEPSAHLYWRLLDALAFSPTAEKVAEPWRQLGRADLTDARVAHRLEDYIAALIESYAR